MRIVCFGDSLSARDDAWPRYVDGARVVAVVGARTEQLADQIREAPDGDAAVVTIGTNDILAIGGPLTVRDQLPALVASLRERYSRVALLNVLLFVPNPPRARHGHELAARRRVVRQALKQSSADLLSPRLGPLCWRRDRIHPNERGHLRIAAAVHSWLQEPDMH